jgi:hypothetical protein
MLCCTANTITLRLQHNRRCVLAVLDHFYRSAIYGESERPLAQLSLTGIASTPRGPSSARLKLTRRLSSSGAMIAAAPAGSAAADRYATYIEQIPAEDGPGDVQLLEDINRSCLYRCCLDAGSSVVEVNAI